MEIIINFLTIIAWFSGALSIVIIYIRASAQYELEHTNTGILNKAIAEYEGKQIVIKKSWMYWVILIVSVSWLITIYTQ